MGLILDTSAIVAWERAIHSGREVDLDPSEELIVPAIVWAEALAGVRLADSPSVRRIGGRGWKRFEG